MIIDRIVEKIHTLDYARLFLKSRYYKEIDDYYDDRASFQLFPYAEDWDNVIKKFGIAIEKAVSPHIDFDQTLKIHDCTSGIGTQAIAMAQMGHQVWASDCSPRMVEECERNAKARELEMSCFVHDLRRQANPAHHGRFDMVVSLNNSLAFVSNQSNTNEELNRAMIELYKTLANDGLLVISLRPYDEYLRDKPKQPPGRRWTFREVEDKKVKFRQKYLWHPNKKHYFCFTHYDFIESDGKRWDRTEMVKVRAWKNQELVESLEAAGFKIVHNEIHSSKHSHYRESWIIGKK